MTTYSSSGYLSDKDAQVLGDFIEDQFKGRVTPHQLIGAAKSKTSPIHHLFDWDDKTAAHQYRLAQARSFIVSIYVESDTDQPMRSFLRVNINNKSTYMNSDQVRESPDLVDQVLEMAKTQLLRWQDRYARYCDFFEFKFEMKGQKHEIKKDRDKTRRATGKNSRSKPQNRKVHDRRDLSLAGQPF